MTISTKWKHSSASINFLTYCNFSVQTFAKFNFKYSLQDLLKQERYDVTGMFPVVRILTNNDFQHPTLLTSYGKINDLETHHSDGLFNWAPLLELTGSDKHSNYT